MKKIMTLLLVLAMTASMFAGCAKDEPKDESTEVVAETEEVTEEVVEEGVNISKAFILESTRIPAFTELVFDEITIIDAEYIAKLGDSHE